MGRPSDGARRTIWDAIRLLHAERIGHGILRHSEPALLAYLAEHGSRSRSARPPTSRTRARASLDDHPTRRCADAGVVVTINSDDPRRCSRTTLTHEYEVGGPTYSARHPGPGRPSRTAVRCQLRALLPSDAIVAEIDAYEPRSRDSPSMPAGGLAGP